MEILFLWGYLWHVWVTWHMSYSVFGLLGMCVSWHMSYLCCGYLACELLCVGVTWHVRYLAHELLLVLGLLLGTCGWGYSLPCRDYGYSSSRNLGRRSTHRYSTRWRAHKCSAQCHVARWPFLTGCRQEIAQSDAETKQAAQKSNFFWPSFTFISIFRNERLGASAQPPCLGHIEAAGLKGPLDSEVRWHNKGKCS